MKRTSKLKLQKPDPGDVYNSNTLTQNVTAMDKIMADFGGNITPIAVTTAVKTRTDDWSINSSYIRILGNGEASIYVNATSKKELTITDEGRIDGAITIADIIPEYAPALSQPLSSLSTGAAFNGYIAPNPTRIVLRGGFGRYTAGKIPVGTIVTLGGIYPLANVPKSIGLEQMSPKSFDSAVHLRNLNKIDAVASRLEMKRTYKSWGLPTHTDVFNRASGITVTAFALQELISGDREFMLEVTKSGGFTGNNSGDIGNTVLGSFVPGYGPGYDVPLFTTSDYSVAKGYISGGTVTLASLAGNTNPTTIRIAGRWVK